MRVISASRRTDLVAFFPGRLAEALRSGRARILGPSGRIFTAGLEPEAVHTVVLWSKNFANLLRNAGGLREALAVYGQVYAHFTVTGLGGTVLEPGAPPVAEALAQLPGLAAVLGHPRRLSVRFDPVLFWREGDDRRTNLESFVPVAEAAAAAGTTDMRMSFAQPYAKAVRRMRAAGLDFLDPEDGEKIEIAARLAETARSLGLNLWACGQNVLTRAVGIRASSCIDGRLLAELHPRRAAAPVGKDRSQRAECRCTASVDIGSYAQTCPHACLYCYANPRRSS
ncbi:MAG: DUF1848 domain-containing protein [Candidatus Aminicenantes bacterium]|nr:DUF1848 domain-containing protein [Candidatus Aminicenantes bacterium]